MPRIKPIKVIAVVGPTASGKSDLALQLAKWLRSRRIAKQFVISSAEIISADSRQVYRGMDIGTGKVLRDKTFPVPNSKFSARGGSISSGKIQKQDFYSSGVQHHLIDVVSPKKQFTADDFKRLGQKAIVDITSRGKIPIIVGGTGFYIDVLLGRILIAEVPPNKKLRAKLEKLSTEQLHSRLLSIDHRRGREIDSHNRHRLIRALEIVLATGKPIPSPVLSIKYKILWLGLKPKNLEKRIKKRLDVRLKQGMVEEVKQLHKRGISWKRLDDLGLEYRWISRYLQNQKLNIKNQNDISKFKNSEYHQKLLREIIKYSKRQMTWFKKNKEIAWISNIKQAHSLVQEFIH